MDASMDVRGAVPVVPSTPAAPPPRPYAGTSVTAMRDTTKWLVSGCAAVAALLVAGLQLTNVADVSSLRAAGAFTVALGAVLLGLWGAWRVVRSGADVLAGTGVSFADLVTLDFESQLWLQRQENSRVSLNSFDFDPILAELHRQRKVVYRETGAVSPSTLLAELSDAYAELVGRLAAPTPDAAAVAEGRRRVSVLESRVGELLDVAALFRTTDQYRTFLRALPTSAGFIIGGVAVFALAAGVGRGSADPPIVAPTKVVVYGSLPDKEVAQCDFKKGVEAMAVGGTWDSPTVVIPHVGECGPARVQAGHSAVVVPVDDGSHNANR